MGSVFNTLAPVFIVVALGAALRRSGFIDERLMSGINRLSYWVGLPCLLFIRIAEGQSAGTATFSRILPVVFIATVVVMLLAFPFARLLRLNRSATGAFVQASFRGNLAFVGLQVVYLAFLSQGEDIANEAMTMAAMAMGPMIVFYNAVCVILLLAMQHAFSYRALYSILKGIALNPLIIATVAGFIWLGISLRTGTAMPVFISRSLSTTGQFALPLALMVVGGAIVSTPVRGRLNAGMITALLKVAACPLFGLWLAQLLNAGHMETAVAMILLGCPTAIASYILTEQLNGDASLAATAIVFSTILSAISLSIVIWMMF